MKKTLLIRVLIAEAIICLLIAFFDRSRVTPSLVFYYPFFQITSLLRKLSLTGVVGNAVAIAIYVALSLIPLLILLKIAKKRKLFAEDHLLLLLSLACFVSLYSMINTTPADPFSGDQTLMNPLAYLPGSKNIIVSTSLYSILFGYFALRLLRIFFSLKTEELHGYLAWMLSALAMFSLAAIILSYFSSLILDLKDQSIKQAMIGDLDMSFYPNMLFTVLRSAVYALPHALNIYLILLALDLLEELRISRYSEQVVALSQKLSSHAARALSWIVTVNIVLNILQIIFWKDLFILNTHAYFPVLSILFVLGLLIFSRYIREGKVLKDDNDLFV